METKTIESAFRGYDIEIRQSFGQEIYKLDKYSDTTSSATTSSDSTSSSGIGTSILNTITSLFGAAGSIAPILPSIGIGSGSRIKEIEAQSKSQQDVINSQFQAQLALQKSSNSNTKYYVLGGVGIFLIMIIFMVLKFKTSK